MSLLTLLRLNLSRLAAATVSASSSSSELIVASGIFSVASTTVDTSLETVIPSGIESAVAATSDSSSELLVARGFFSVTATEGGTSLEAVFPVVTDAAAVVDSSASTERITAGSLAAHVIDISLSSEFIGPVRWIGAGRWSTAGLVNPRPASVEDWPSRSAERLMAAAVMSASVMTVGVSGAEVSGQVVPADFWTLNREVMLAELDEDLLAVAS